MKIEIFDAQGKLVDTLPASKHRGVNRAIVVDASEAAQRAAGGHRRRSARRPVRGCCPASTP